MAAAGNGHFSIVNTLVDFHATHHRFVGGANDPKPFRFNINVVLRIFPPLSFRKSIYGSYARHVRLGRIRPVVSRDL